MRGVAGVAMVSRRWPAGRVADRAGGSSAAGLQATHPGGRVPQRRHLRLSDGDDPILSPWGRTAVKMSTGIPCAYRSSSASAAFALEGIAAGWPRRRIGSGLRQVQHHSQRRRACRTATPALLSPAPDSSPLPRAAARCCNTERLLASAWPASAPSSRRCARRRRTRSAPPISGGKASWRPSRWSASRKASRCASIPASPAAAAGWSCSRTCSRDSSSSISAMARCRWASPRRWTSTTSRPSSRSRCATASPGPTARRSMPTTSSGAGSACSTRRPSRNTPRRSIRSRMRSRSTRARWTSTSLA